MAAGRRCFYLGVRPSGTENTEQDQKTAAPNSQMVFLTTLK